MSFENDITIIKKLAEADFSGSIWGPERPKKKTEDSPVFKAASPEQIAARPKVDIWTDEMIVERFPNEVSLLKDCGLDPDVSPENGHIVGFFNEDGDILDSKELADRFKQVITAAQTIENAVRGPIHR